MSDLILPIIILLIIIPPMIKRQGVYDSFIKGAGEGLAMLKNVFLPMLAVTVALYMMRAAGFFDMAAQLVSGIAERTGFASEVLPLALIRPFSGGAAIAALGDILSTSGADSKAGLTASIIAGGSETTFYALSVYFSATKKSCPKRLIIASLTADLAAVICAAAVVNFLV